MVYYASILVYGDIFQNHLKNELGKISQQFCQTEMKKINKMWEIQTQTLPMKIPDNIIINGSQSP